MCVIVTVCVCESMMALDLVACVCVSPVFSPRWRQASSASDKTDAGSGPGHQKGGAGQAGSRGRLVTWRNVGSCRLICVGVSIRRCVESIYVEWMHARRCPLKGGFLNRAMQREEEAPLQRRIREITGKLQLGQGLDALT